MTQDEVPCVLLLLAELHRCTLVRMSENQANLPYHFCFSENWVIGSCLLSSELLPKGDIFPFYRIPAGTSEKSSHALTGTDCQGTALASTSPAQQVSQLPAVFVPTKDLCYQELHNMMLCQVRDCWQDMTGVYIGSLQKNTCATVNARSQQVLLCALWQDYLIRPASLAFLGFIDLHYIVSFFLCSTCP